MPAVNLNFSHIYTPPPASAVNLDFGTELGDPPPPVEWQGLRKTIALPWQATAPLGRAVTLRWKDYDAMQRRTVTLPWESAAGPIIRAVALPWDQAQPLGRVWRLPWHSAQQIGRDWRLPWKSAQRAGRAWRLPWDQAQPLGRVWRFPWHAAAPVSLTVAVPWEGAAMLLRTVAVPWFSPPMQRVSVRIPWEQGQPPPFVWPPPAPYVPPPPDPRVYIPPPASAVDLDFSCPRELYLGGVPLAFRALACTPRAPYLRVYVIMTSVVLIRVSDGAPIAAAAVDVSVDMDSWSWQFSARLLNRAALELVMPSVGSAPVAVQATINGHVFVALVESWTESRRNGYSEWTIRGRSQSATLADPYQAAVSYTETSALNAHQLADNEMPPTGWTLDWDTVDWLVPAGAYSYRDLTTMGALQQIAGAVGAVVQSHQADAKLIVMPRYPISPWEWATATPSVAITADILTSGASEWQPRPAYDGVYVMGTTQGVSVWVKRTGTAGDQLAEMVTDPLITHVDAGRERGRNILAAAGAWSRETIQIPLMPPPGNPGLLLPGALIEVADGLATWRGQVVGVKIAAARGDTLTVWQNVEVERWHG